MVMLERCISAMTVSRSMPWTSPCRTPRRPRRPARARACRGGRLRRPRRADRLPGQHRAGFVVQCGAGPGSTTRRTRAVQRAALLFALNRFIARVCSGWVMDSQQRPFQSRAPRRRPPRRSGTSPLIGKLISCRAAASRPGPHGSDARVWAQQPGCTRAPGGARVAVAQRVKPVRRRLPKPIAILFGVGLQLLRMSGLTERERRTLMHRHMIETETDRQTRVDLYPRCQPQGLEGN